MLKWNETSKNLNPLKEALALTLNGFSLPSIKVVDTWKKLRLFDVNVNIWKTEKPIKEAFYFDFKQPLSAFNKFSN